MSTVEFCISYDKWLQGITFVISEWSCLYVQFLCINLPRKMKLKIKISVIKSLIVSVDISYFFKTGNKISWIQSVSEFVIDTFYCYNIRLILIILIEWCNAVIPSVHFISISAQFRKPPVCFFASPFFIIVSKNGTLVILSTFSVSYMCTLIS